MNENKNDNLIELIKLNKRVGVVISILLRMVPESSNVNLRNQVKILADLSIRPRDIAEILGRTQTHINKELAGIRKKGRTKLN